MNLDVLIPFQQNKFESNCHSLNLHFLRSNSITLIHKDIVREANLIESRI